MINFQIETYIAIEIILYRIVFPIWFDGNTVLVLSMLQEAAFQLRISVVYLWLFNIDFSLNIAACLHDL